MHSQLLIDQTRAVQSHEVDMSSGSRSTAPGGGKRGAAEASEGEWVEPELPGRRPLRGVRRVGEPVPNGRLLAPKSPVVGVAADGDSLTPVAPPGGPKAGGFGIESDSGRFARLPPRAPPTGDDVPDDGTLIEPPAVARPPVRPGETLPKGAACEVLGRVAAGEQATDSGVTAHEGVEVESEQTLCAWPDVGEEIATTWQQQQTGRSKSQSMLAILRKRVRCAWTQDVPTSVRIGCSLGLGGPSSLPGVAPASPSTLEAQLPREGASWMRMRPARPPETMRPVCERTRGGQANTTSTHPAAREATKRGEGPTVSVVLVWPDESEAVDV
jgi:hypothetical protein